MPLLRNNNSDLRRDRVWVWSLPAWLVTLPDGTRFNTCVSAGVCTHHCYALRGTFMFANVRAAHTRNLLRLLDDLAGWQQDMTAELAHPKFVDGWVRIHDGGDFFSDDYLLAWFAIATATPTTTFYTYTKEVERVKRLAHLAPPNFLWVFSYGGKHDGLIEDTDRRCDVFPDEQALRDAGFHDQAASDLLAVTGPTAVGIVVNNHPGAATAMRNQSLRQLQANRKRPPQSTQAVP